jgi:DNA-binding GntR family transcriptional regulator
MDNSGGDNAARRPAHEQVYRRLRAQILFGDISPGQAVTIQGLAQTLDAGLTPVREAIRRLTAEGALRFQGNRRVSVPELTRQELEELVFLRISVEGELVRRAARQITQAGIAHLRQVDAALDRAIAAGDVAGYLRGNHAFHADLYALAAAPILSQVADAAWLRFGPSLRIVCGRYGTQNLPDRHKEMLAALRDADATAAVAALERDVVQGMEQIAAMLDAPA